MKLIIITYHYIRELNKNAKAIFPFSINQLRNQVDQIGRVCEFVSLSNLLNGRLPERSPSCLLTFDDGFQEQFHAYKLLRKIKVPSMINIPTGYLLKKKACNVHKIHKVLEAYDSSHILEFIKDVVEKEQKRDLFEKSSIDGEDRYRNDQKEIATIKYLLNYLLDKNVVDRIVDKLFNDIENESDWVQKTYLKREQIKDLGDDESLGSHSHSHASLTKLDAKSVQNELKISKNILEKIIGRPLLSISYPFGTAKDMSLKILNIARDLGYKCGLTMIRGVNSEGCTLKMKRYDCNELSGGKRELSLEKLLDTRAN